MYIAQKPCSFAGQTYRVGEMISDGVILPEAVSRLKKGGVIAEVGEAGPLLPAAASIESTGAVQIVSVPILEKEGVTYMNMTIEELLEAIATIQKADDEIIKDIAKIENEDVLIFVDVMKDAVGSIHEAAVARAEKIAAEPKIPDTESALMQLKRDELEEIAAGYDLEVEESRTKRILVSNILKAQKRAGV